MVAVSLAYSCIDKQLMHDGISVLLKTALIISSLKGVSENYRSLLNLTITITFDAVNIYSIQLHTSTTTTTIHS